MTSEAPAHRVLVVDDEPNIVDVVTMALRFQGFAVESAGTGGDAIAAVSHFRPDLIVLDVMLPDMEGFEVALVGRPNVLFGHGGRASSPMRSGDKHQASGMVPLRAHPMW